MHGQATRSAARRKVKKKFVEDTERESGMILQTDSTTRSRVMGVRITWSRGHCHVFEMPKIWQRRVLCGR